MTTAYATSATRWAALPALLAPWYRRHRRRFSFRRRPTAYKVLLAELLLRKTRARDADRVFPALLAMAPNARALADVDPEALERLVAPLGLPTRARNLIALGRALLERHQGSVPRSREALLALPGIGPYGAGAVLSIGFGIPSPMVDGPMGRVLRRLAGIRENGRAPYYDKRVWSFAERLLPASGAREFQLALLDVGALLCRPHQPLCPACPLSKICSYARRGRGKR